MSAPDPGAPAWGVGVRGSDVIRRMVRATVPAAAGTFAGLVVLALSGPDGFTGAVVAVVLATSSASLALAPTRPHHPRRTP